MISGSKIWSTGAQHADYAMCLARTDWDVPEHRGLTWFAVPTDAAGVTVRPIRQIDGGSGFCEAFLDDVVVSDADVIGEVNQGWTVAQTMLVYERGGASPAPTPPSRERSPPTWSSWPGGRDGSTTPSPGSSSPGPTSTTTPSTTSVGAWAR